MRRYDTANYFEIDRRLGDKALFRKVVKQCHARGIRVVLDGEGNINDTSSVVYSCRGVQ
jgi:glycosidase